MNNTRAIYRTKRVKMSEGSNFFVALLLVVRLAVTRKVQAVLSCMGFCLRVEADHAASAHAQLTDNSVFMIRSIAFLRVAPSKVRNVPTGSFV